MEIYFISSGTFIQLQYIYSCGQKKKMIINIQLSTQNGRFKLTKEYLGSGSFGEVYKAVNITNNEMAAVKIITSNNFQATINEVNILRLLNKNVQSQKQEKQSKKFSPVLKLLGTHRNYNQFYIITQFYGLSLNKLIKQIGPLQMLPTLRVFKSILVAMAPLRDCKILHRDVKPQNILIVYNQQTQSFDSKMCDFGLAIREQTDKQSTFCNNRVGTLIYQSPEVIKLKQYSQKSQIWSLGIILYSLIYNKLPFQQHIYFNSETLYNQIFNENIQFGNIPIQIAKIGEKCLANCSKKRINFNQLFHQIDKILIEFQQIYQKHLIMKKISKLNKLAVSDNINTIDCASSTDISIQTCSNEQSCLKGPELQFYQLDQLNSQFMGRLQKTLLQVKQRIQNLKSPKKIELQLLKVIDNLLSCNYQKQFINFFSPTIRNIIIQNINKIKLICEYSEDEKQISFNLKEFMLADSLFNLYEIARNPHWNMNDIKFAQKINILDEHLSYNGQSKTMKYYKELRTKILNFDSNI